MAGATAGMGMPSNARPTSIGSAGVDAPPSTTATTAANPNAASGPVMSRIQPVDLEGWIRKKGERYATWKPRYSLSKDPISSSCAIREPKRSKATST